MYFYLFLQIHFCYNTRNVGQENQSKNKKLSIYNKFSPKHLLRASGALICILSFFCISIDANALLSKDGVIQNVQTYSSNPFWQPGNSYNQRMPTAVYATGTAVETSDCQSIIASLVYSHCSQNNNCRGAQLSDVRPTLMLQLSRIPGGNYATACAGYLDTAFDNYKKQYGNAAPVIGATFPTATTANPTASGTTPQINNPYKTETPDWQSDIMERKLELQQLQAANGAGNIQLERAGFPTTISDISFEERIANAKQGYEPYAGKSAFVPIEIEDEQDYLARKNKKAEEHDLLSLSHEEFCKKYPNHSNCKKDNPNDNNIQDNNLDVTEGEILFIL